MFVEPAPATLALTTCHEMVIAAFIAPTGPRP